MRVYIDNDDALEMLMDRVIFWTEDPDVIGLYENFYEERIACGWFEEIEFDVKSIVDNDYINWTSVYTEDEIKQEEIDEELIVSRFKNLCLVMR